MSDIHEVEVSSNYNVIDKLKNFSKEQLQEYYKNNTINAAVAMTHISGDFNLSTVIRNANFCGFKEAFYIGGKRHWDRRGAVGVQNYIPVTYCKTIDEFFECIKGKYTPVALENNVTLNKPIHNLFDFEWPTNPIIICGEEQVGIPREVLDKIDHFVEIPAYGTVRSMNVGTASGIAMSVYAHKAARL